MSFSFVTGSGNPPTQDVLIGSLGPGTLDWRLEASTSDGGNWLTVSASSGTAPSTVTVGVVANALPSGGLVAGNFVGNLVFRSATSTITIPVSVAVGANVFVQLPPITFTKAFGGANPAAQNLNIASTGTNFNFDFNWYHSNGGAWFSASSAGFNCCTTPRALTATVIASPSLAAGTYTGQIVVTVEGNGSTAMTIPVILMVAGPVATLDVDASISSTKYDALTDGLLIIRYLFGLTGSSLTTGALGGTATRTDPACDQDSISMASALRLTLMGTAWLTRRPMACSSFATCLACAAMRSSQGQLVRKRPARRSRPSRPTC